VRVTDEFMNAVERDGDFSTRAVIDGRRVKTYKRARRSHEQDRRSHLAVRRSRHAVRHHHQSLAHVEEHRRINASNPCSSTCSSTTPPATWPRLNLMKFAPNGQFDVEAYKHAVDVTITAQEILVDNSGYPTEMIARNSHDYRPLGLGYANLGALLMASALPYDSDAGRDYAACVTAIMCGEAYLQSARIAEQCPARPPATTKAQGDESDRRRLPRLLRQPRAVPRRHPHAPRLGQQHWIPEMPRQSPPRIEGSSKPASAGTKPLSPTARSTAIATRRSPCSRPPAPSAS
jgi:ribonucleoside-diphosphate reductase alpha chain